MVGKKIWRFVTFTSCSSNSEVSHPLWWYSRLKCMVHWKPKPGSPLKYGIYGGLCFDFTRCHLSAVDRRDLLTMHLGVIILKSEWIFRWWTPGSIHASYGTLPIFAVRWGESSVPGRSSDPCQFSSDSTHPQKNMQPSNWIENFRKLVRGENKHNITISLKTTT